jgi:hypothetical protein
MHLSAIQDVKIDISFAYNGGRLGKAFADLLDASPHNQSLYSPSHLHMDPILVDVGMNSQTYNSLIHIDKDFVERKENLREMVIEI